MSTTAEKWKGEGWCVLKGTTDEIIVGDLSYSDAVEYAMTHHRHQYEARQVLVIPTIEATVSR